jgi:hypothetical protein
MKYLLVWVVIVHGNVTPVREIPFDSKEQCEIAKMVLTPPMDRRDLEQDRDGPFCVEEDDL